MTTKRQIPVEKGKIYTITIDRLGANGEGVGRIDGFTIFVPGALPGEIIEGRITLVKKQYGQAKLVKICKASPDRVVPKCPVYEACGGCQLQHISYEGELIEKRQQVLDALERIAILKVSM